MLRGFWRGKASGQEGCCCLQRMWVWRYDKGICITRQPECPNCGYFSRLRCMLSEMWNWADSCTGDWL